jgi:long-chain acyl-CoA synthetase
VDIELTEHPGRVISRLARQVELAVAAVDLSMSQYRALSLLDDGKEAASALADKLAVSRPSVTGVIDGLVARGLVERHNVDGDRRGVGLDLTKEGRSLLMAADTAVDRRLGDIAAYGSSAGFETLGSWKEALDAYRTARRSGAPRAGTEKVTA